MGIETVVTIVLGIIYLLICVAIVILTLLQDSKESGVSALGGAETSIFGSKGSSKESFLAKMTVVFGIIFAVVAVAMTAIIVNLIKG